MSLQKLCKYADILGLSMHIQNPTQADQTRTSIIQNVAIAGLIESGAPYKLDNNLVYFETDNGYIKTSLNSLYPYLSQNYKTYLTKQGLISQPAAAAAPQSSSTPANENQFSNNPPQTNTPPSNTIDNNITQNNNVQSSTEYNDILSLNKNDLTYERCNLELTDPSGNTIRFSVHSAPLRNLNDDIIIVRLKLLGNAGSYIHTEFGNTTTFEYNGINILVARDMTKSDKFSCIFKCSNPNIVINKINIETGGSKGNPVIYDENLELRIYPFPNIREKNSGKMVFGNNKQGEAAFLYFIQNNGEVIASSGSERKPGFIYDNSNLVLTAKWKDDIISFTAIENN